MKPIKDFDENVIMHLAQKMLDFETDAIVRVKYHLNGNFLKAVKMIFQNSGKVIVTAIGKSGLVGQKFVATLNSTGTPAVFMHATEAVHGDLGMISEGDVVVMVSKSGATYELLRLVPLLKNKHCLLIGILGNLNSALSEQMDIVLDSSVEREADPLNLAPTSSSLAAMALGDSLALCVAAAKGFTEEDYGLTHPSGQLGRNLSFRVENVMHVLPKVAKVSEEDTIRKVVIELSSFPLGAAVVLDQASNLLGIITDGDIRRAFQKQKDILEIQAHEIMTANPVVTLPSDSVKHALELMENRRSQISVLPVVDDGNHCLGLLRLHDIYKANLEPEK